MNSHVVPLELCLVADQPIDIFLLQWHTPNPDGGIPKPVCEAKASVLKSLRDWLCTEFTAPTRPCFVVTPELSTCLDHLSLLQELVQALDRPVVAVVGLEFISWNKYRELLESFTSMPEADWAVGANAGQLVNTAAILVKDARGNVTSYLQPKINPSDPENIFRCDRSLLFRSIDQTPGRRLNFSVHICADFTNADTVRDFRRACVNAGCDTPLDLAFVLQRNADQHRIEFKQGTLAYFEPPMQMIPTQPGCAVFLNNAAPRRGKSECWGRSKLQFHWRERWRQDRVAPTYWLRDESEHNHQSAILREHGPGIYRLTYLPVELAHTRPGQGHAGPFLNDEATYCALDQDIFPTLPASDAFRPIPPVTHWLLCEWAASIEYSETRLRAAGIPAAVRNEVVDAMKREANDAEAILPEDDSASQALTTTYFLPFRDDAGYPTMSREPKKWCPRAADAASKLLEGLSLLSIAASACAEALTLEPSRTHHARSPSLGIITFLWGGSLRYAHMMITDYVSFQRAHSPAELLEPRHLLVLVDPRDPPSESNAAELLKAASTRLDDPNLESDAPHLQPPGEVVNPEAANQLSITSYSLLDAEVPRATDVANLRTRLLSVLE